MPDPYPADDFYPFTWETEVAAEGEAAPLPSHRQLESTLAAELVVDPGETGFASFLKDDAGLPTTASNDTGTGTESWTDLSGALTQDDDGAQVALGDPGTPISGSEGHNFPDSAAATGSFTTPNNWQNVSGVKASGGTQAVLAALTTGLSGYIHTTNFGFNIPANATVTGVEVKVRRDVVAGSTVADWDLHMVLGGIRRGNNVRHAGNWSSSMTTETYGGNTGFAGWGVTPTAAQVNSSQFGFDLSVAINPSGTAQVDYISMKVYYRTPTVVDSTSHWLKLTNLGLALDPGATVKGVSVRLRRRATAANRAKVTAIKLVKGGTVTGDDLAGSGEPWLPTSYADRTYGGAANRWGVSLSESDVEASGFGVAVAVRGQQTTAAVDVAEVTVHYLVAGAEVAVTGAPLVRFTPNDVDPGAVPTEVSFQTEIPGGFSAGQMTVARSEFFDPERYVYAAARVYEFETNRTVYEGRVVGISDSGESVTFEMEGWAAHLEDDHSAKMVWYDRDLSSWQGMSVQRKLDQIALGRSVSDAGVVPDTSTGEASLETGVDGPWLDLALPRVEGWYRSATPIKFVDYAWKKTGTIADEDSILSWIVRVAEDDVLTDAVAPDYFAGAGPESGTLEIAENDKDWANVQLLADDTGGLEGEHYAVFWTLLGVIGDHGLDLQGTVAAPATGRGLFPHQIIRHCVETWAPLLTVGEIEETDFVVPHATDPEATTAREMIEKYTLFGGGTLDYPIDWWVYEDRTFGAGTGDYGKLWRTRYEPDGTEAAESGPDVQRLINGCIVTYNDGVSDLSVGPPDSGATDISTELVDISDSNPANRTGARHWELFNAGVTTQEAAVQIGKLIMAERNRQEWRGEVRIKKWVLDAASNEHPAAMVRAGDRLVIEDDEDTRERRIVQTTYDANSETVSCSIGASPDRLDTLLARLSVVLEGRLS